MSTDRPIPGHITGLYVFTVLNLFVLLNVALVNGDITVMDIKLNKTVVTYDDMEAEFGPPFPVDGILGRIVYVNPRNACHPVDPPPEVTEMFISWIAVIAREDCDFALKVFNAQQAGYSLAIIHNSKGDDALVRMGRGKYGARVHIPSVFVGYTNGMSLVKDYNYTKKNILVNVYDDDFVPDYKMYLWPFAIVIGTCFVLMVVFMVVKYLRDVRRRQRSRISKKHLKRIPIKKFKKGDYYDVCAICLDDYEEGEKLRVLPCAHAYHVKCIDPWLLKNKKTCPVCKRRVMPGHEAESESDSDEENGNSHNASERTPLLSDQNRSGPSRRSTFDTSGLPEAVRVEATQQSSGELKAVHEDGDEDDDAESEEDADSVVSENGAIGGVAQESVEVVVETDNAGVVNTTYNYSSDEEVSVVNANKNKDMKREMNEVV